MARFLRRHRAAVCAALICTLFGVGRAATAAQQAVPWLDLVEDCDHLVLAEVESLHGPDARIERVVLRVEEALIGRPPARIVMRLSVPHFAPPGVRAPLRGLAARGALLGGSMDRSQPTRTWQHRGRLLAFVETHPASGRRFVPVRGAHGVFPLAEDREPGTRRLVSTLLAAGDGLDLAAALPALRRADDAPTDALLTAALAELARRVGPRDAELLTDLVCEPADYWPAVQPDALRWAGRLRVSPARACVARAARRSVDPALRGIAADALADLQGPSSP